MIETEELHNRIDLNPFDQSLHDALISRLRTSRDTDYQKLFRARLHKHEYFLFTDAEINDTFEDLLSIRQTDDRIALLEELYALLLKDIPSVFYWVEYLKFSLENKQAADLQQLFSAALNDTVHDFANTSKIWQIVLSYFEQTYQSSQDPRDLERLWALHLKRLGIPHETLDTSFSQTSKFVSAYYSDQYETLMAKASFLYSKTQRVQRYYEKYELDLKKDPQNPQIWKEYIEMIAKHSNGDFRKFSTVFYRSLLIGDGDWKSVWLSYIYQLYRLEDDKLKNELLEDVLVKFCKKYPESCASYAQLIRNCPVIENGAILYEKARRRIDFLDLMRTSDYNDWKILALAILSYENSIHNAPRLTNDINQFVDFAVNENIDVFHSVEKLAIMIYESKGHIDDAKELLNQLLAKFSDQCEVWLYCLDFFKRNGFGYDAKSTLLKKAIENIGNIDWPERIFEEQLGFESIYGDTSTYQEALIAADEAMKHIYLGRMETFSTPAPEEITITKGKRAAQDAEAAGPNKRQKPITRSRELFSVKVSNLPPPITEAALSGFFRDCGEVREILIYENNSAFEAIIEFQDERSVMSALTKDAKSYGNNKITVKRLLNAVVWVTNFPPSFTESSVKHVFDKVGKVVSVRFPTQVAARERRFSYVEYSDPVDAQRAITELNGFQIEDATTHKMFALVVRLSDAPTIKKIPLFKREVYISNLHFSCTEEDVRNFFKDCGTIENVILPLSAQMQEKRNKNSGYGFVVFHSEASVKSALQLNSHLLKGRPLNVHPSRKNPGTNDKYEDFDDDCTIALFNLPSTADKPKLQEYLESYDLRANKVLYIPQKSSALVQFTSIADAGKASLKLESAKFVENTLRVGTKKDLDSSKAQPSSTTFVPTFLRRRRK